jgi:polar amino acid transport system permease protein
MSTDLITPLLDGALVTLELTGLAAVLGCVVAFVVGSARLAGTRFIRWPAAVYVELFRGTSALVLMFWFFFALPLLGWQLTPLFAGVLALGLSYGAYGAEVVRGAIVQVPKPQLEAAVALNFSLAQRARLVVLPLAIRAMLPPLGNLLIDLLKATSLASLITLSDMTEHGRLTTESGGHITQVYTALLLLYFVLAFILTRLVRLLERRVSRHLTNHPGTRARLLSTTAPTLETGGGGES